MSAFRRLVVLSPLLLLVLVGRAEAASINVAEFRWDLITSPGVECPADDPVCLPEDPVTSSVFTLTNIWDGPDPAVTLFDNQFQTPGAAPVPFFDLEATPLLNFDQIALPGVPALASTHVSFFFGDEVVTLGATLSGANNFAVLSFDPASVPEPGTLSLLAIGAVGMLRRKRGAAPSRHD